MSDRRPAPASPALTELRRAERELQALRARMARSASRFKEDVRVLTDFRRPIRERPWRFVCAAFALGFFFATTHRREFR